MKLNYKKVMFVGFAFMIIQIFWMAYDAIVPLMLVNKFGMNQTWSGIIMAIDNILAVFLLPIFGSLSDKSSTKLGKRTPFILIGTLCAIVAFFGLSFVDYLQLNNLGEQAQMPAQYESTVESRKANEYFFEKNYSVLNNEYADYVSQKEVNGLGKNINLQDYVSTILYDKSYSELTDVQRGYAKDWYLNIDLSNTFILTENGYLVFEFTENTVKKVVYNGDEAPVLVDASDKEKELSNGFGSANAYSTLVSSARSAYASEVTTNNPGTLVLFIGVLLIVLISMAVFRSPAVALMPDVVVKPLRSKGNAVINLMGIIGGILILGLGMVIGTDKVHNQMMSYMGYMGCVCGAMLIVLFAFMFTVKEPKWSAQMLEDQKMLDAKAEALAKQKAEKETADGNSEKSDESKGLRRLTKGELVSLLLILSSVALWYMGYNAVTSKYSLYAINVLGKPYNSVLIAAQAAGAVSYIPIGIISSKIGRKKMILIGVAMLTGAFFAANFVHRGTMDLVLYLLFALAGIGWAAINVNSFPMVVELSSESDIGKFTGYYYTASMAAQIITPVLSGKIMDIAGSMAPLFVYGTICVFMSFITMLFVKHGDSKPDQKKSALEYLDASDD